MKSKLLLATLAVAAGAMVSLPASAYTFFGGPYGDNPLGFNLTINGLLRAEVAGRVDAPANWNNQNGNPFDKQTLGRQAFVPPGLLMPAETAPYKWGAIPVPNTPETNNANILVSRGNVTPFKSNTLNYAVLRSDINLTFRFQHGFKLTAKLRALYQPDVYNDFDATTVSGIQGGIATGPHVGPEELYGGRPNFYGYVVDGNTNPVPLEWTGKNYMFYFPALVLEWHHGPLDIRVGNQQIAWGQAIFLRVFDVPDGLDFRQHSILDRGLEEFSQIRVPAPGIRVQYQVTDHILFDGYIQKFQPSYLGNPNTPYNLIPAQFSVRDTYYTSGASRWTSLSGGFRLKADYGQWGWELGFVRRYNPLGSIGWANTGIVRPHQGGPGSVGDTINALYAAKQPMGTGTCTTSYNQGRCRRYATQGDALAHAPFSPGPGGVYTHQEWFYYANKVRVDAVAALNAAINEFPGSRDSYASPVTTVAEANAELSTFFSTAGGSLRGAIARRYFQENDYLLGFNYVIHSSNGFLNQIIVNLEAQYTPKLHPLLTYNATSTYPAVNNYKIAIDFDKWYRIFQGLPSTFMVLEGFTSQRVDLVNRDLRGYGGTATKPATGIHGNANYVVFGFMQPFKNKVFTLEFASLYDPRGGVLLQPGLLWAPGHGFQVFGAFNYINGKLYGNPGENLLSSIAFAQEAFIRLTYNFSM